MRIRKGAQGKTERTNNPSEQARPAPTPRNTPRNVLDSEQCHQARLDPKPDTRLNRVERWHGLHHRHERTRQYQTRYKDMHEERPSRRGRMLEKLEQLAFPSRFYERGFVGMF
jgi:hypothetical protein